MRYMCENFRVTTRRERECEISKLDLGENIRKEEKNQKTGKAIEKLGGETSENSILASLSRSAEMQGPLSAGSGGPQTQALRPHSG